MSLKDFHEEEGDQIAINFKHSCCYVLSLEHDDAVVWGKLKLFVEKCFSNYEDHTLHQYDIVYFDNDRVWERDGDIIYFWIGSGKSQCYVTVRNIDPKYLDFLNFLKNLCDKYFSR